MDAVGVIHGRFQMLHVGHMEYLLAGKSRCRRLVVGITNPDPSSVIYTAANPHRSLPVSNPFSYYERMQMIEGALLEAGVSRDEFDIVPFPIDNPGRLFNYVPASAKYYMTIYDEWSLEKKHYLESVGCDIEVMWTRSNGEKVTSGTEVRDLVASGGDWGALVPPFVKKYVMENGIDERIRRCANGGGGDDA